MKQSYRRFESNCYVLNIKSTRYRMYATWAMPGYPARILGRLLPGCGRVRLPRAGCAGAARAQVDEAPLRGRSTPAVSTSLLTSLLKSPSTVRSATGCTNGFPEIVGPRRAVPPCLLSLVTERRRPAGKPVCRNCIKGLIMARVPKRKFIRSIFPASCIPRHVVPEALVFQEQRGIN